MIEGFHVDVTGAEMKTLLEGRWKYHEEKAALYSKKVTELQAALVGVEEEAVAIGKVSNTGTGSLDQSAKQHSDKAIFFKFAAEHTAVNETYRLSQEDLVLLGIMSNRHMW